MHILLHALPFIYVSWQYELSALQVKISEENKVSTATEVHNCKNIRHRVKTVE